MQTSLAKSLHLVYQLKSILSELTLQLAPYTIYIPPQGLG